MSFHFFKLATKLCLLASLAILAGGPLLADETKSTSETKTRSSTSQVQVHVEGGTSNDKTESGKDQQQVAVVLNVSGDQSNAVKSAIEKLEKQLKGSGLPEALQQKALEALRSQVATQTKEESKAEAPKDQAKRNTQSQQRYEIRLPFDRLNPNLPSAMVQAFASSSSNAFGPAQKKKLRNAISETLEQNGVSAETIEKTLSNVDKALEEIASQSKAWARASEKLPFRVGIGCKSKVDGDPTPGLEVERVFDDSPAATAGIKPGDRLISIDGQPIQKHDDIVTAVQKAGEENRSVRLEAKRGEVSTTYELKPNQTAIAELNIDMKYPGGIWGEQHGMPPMLFPGQAWVMPSTPAMPAWPSGAPNLSSDPKFQNDIEKNMDGLRRDLSRVHDDLEEMKSLLKKLSEKP